MKANIKRLTILGAMACALTIGNISAYFTDGDTATNTFTLGKVSIDLQEPGWTPHENITPGQEFRKDPLIKNDGINDAFVFIKVGIPYANIETSNLDGTKNPKENTELFSYEIKDGWTELITKKQVNIQDGMIEHVYAYTGTNSDTMQKLSAEQSTSALFDWIRFANIVEDQRLEGTVQNVIVQGYGIQTQNLNDEKTNIDGNNTDGKVTPLAVWSLLEKQMPKLDVTEIEETYTDIKQ